MDEEQITINCILECLDFGLNFDKKDIQDLLNIVRKKNEIIKKQSYTNKKMRKKIKTVRKERNKQQKVIDKQNKVIDEMAKYMEDGREIGEIEEFCNKKDCYADEYINGHCQKCLNCIKQYFIRKANGDER